jgi:hypothetical protein
MSRAPATTPRPLQPRVLQGSTTSLSIGGHLFLLLSRMLISLVILHRKLRLNRFLISRF